MDNVRLSIIIPVYNAEAYLERCIHSALNQEYHSFEVILVDDGSTDQSSVICNRFAVADPRVTVIHKENGGVSSARNAGIDSAQGEYIMFLDSDDALLPFAVEDMMDNIHDEDILIAGHTVFVDGVAAVEKKPESGRSYKGAFFADFFNENIKDNCELLDSCWAKVFKRKVVGGLRFNEELDYAEDKLFVFSVLAVSSSALVFADSVYAYHMHDNSLGSDISSDNHLLKLKKMIPYYEEVILKLNARFPSVYKVASLYHKDLVGRYICRMLNELSTRKSDLLTLEDIVWIYRVIDKDNKKGIFSIRAGQIGNMILYKIRSPKFTMWMYGKSAKIRSLFKKK